MVVKRKQQKGGNAIAKFSAQMIKQHGPALAFSLLGTVLNNVVESKLKKKLKEQDGEGRRKPRRK